MQYLGPVAYYALLAGSGQVTIEAHENFVKSTYRNRCEILTAAGPMRLSIPLAAGRDHHQPYKEVKISYNEDWQRYHWKSIVSAYNNSPYFEYYRHHFEPIYTDKQPYLFDWNTKLFDKVCAILKLEATIAYTSGYQMPPATGYGDMRSKVHPSTDKDAAGEMVVITPYYQVFADRHGFFPKASIIDLIFNEGPASKGLLTKYFQGLAG